MRSTASSASSPKVPSFAALGFPEPHPGQQRIRHEAKRFNVLVCGRRFGKTTEGERLDAETALAGQPAAYVAPYYRMVETAYAELHDYLRPLILRKLTNERLELTTGGVIDFWSMHNGADAIRGRKYQRVVLDEAAMVVDLKAVWQKVIRPTLADLLGDAWFLSTPRRGGGFQELYELGQEPDSHEWMSWRMPTSTNPHIDPEEIEAARRGSSDAVFAQEWLADFEAAESDLVFPQFSTQRHVRWGDPVSWEQCIVRYGGYDLGGSDPTAVIPVGLWRAQDGSVHAHQYGEYYKRQGGATVDILYAELAAWHMRAPFTSIEPDPASGAETVNESLRALGLPVRGKPITRDKALRNNIQAFWLDKDLLTINEQCGNSIHEFAGYRNVKKRDPETGDKFVTSTPFDHHADAMDARGAALVAAYYDEMNRVKSRAVYSEVRL